MTPTLLPRTRRQRIVVSATAITVVGLALAGCSTAETTSGTGSSSTSTTVTAQPPATPGSVAALAQAFAATLSADQQADLQQEYTLANAERWSNLPQAMVRGNQSRIGLQLVDLTDAQKSAFEALMKAATGTAANEGWDELQQLLNADDYLAANGGNSDYGSTNYYIAFLGAPGDSGTWELQFGGHHFALANTYTDGALAGATPSFRGVEPFGSFEQNGVTNDPLQQELDAYAALLASLTPEQLATATLPNVYNNLVLGPGADWSFPTTREGLKVSELSDAQKKLVVAAMATYVNDIDEADAATILAKYTAELDDTYLAFSGTTALTSQDDYVRIDGPSVWMEFSMQRGIVLPGTHPHSVWRDRTTDYGTTQQ